MSSEKVAIRVSGLSKCYQIYDSPADRLRQFIYPRLTKLFGGGVFRRYFREFWAIKDVSFEIKKGETLGIIGRNGSGKSTLLQLICGTLTPTEGKVEVNGRVAALLELGSGFNPEFTGRENIYMNAAVLGLSRAEIDSKFEEIISFADIGTFIDQPVKTYSSGMVMRLAFAVIANVDADVLIIDEALAVGDIFFTQKCMSFLKNFMKSGTVLFVSHDIGAVTGLCTRSLLLKNGSMDADGSPKLVSERYVEQLYGDAREVSVVKNGRQDVADVKKRTVSEINYKDMRSNFINGTVLRNDIQVFHFSESANCFGEGGALIENVQILDLEGNQLTWLVGGQDEEIELKISCIAKKDLISPIVGFQIKNKLGQIIFCENTYLDSIQLGKLIRVKKHHKFFASFQFRLPVLPSGDYSISPAVAEGTQENHVQHHWIHDAIAFKVHSSSVCMGIIGLPLESVELKILE
jgi:lipopolysaccharide transport system ATP-binding protein